MERLVYESLDNKTTIRKIGETYGLNLELTQRIVSDLIDRGLVAIYRPDVAPETTIRSEPPPPREEKTVSDGPTGKSLSFEMEVHDYFDAIKVDDYYSFLKIDPDASRSEIRNRFFELSKKFHPDKAFRQKNDELRQRMETVFRHLSEIYDVLSNAKKRAEYDETIADQLELYKIEKQLRQAMNPKQPEEKKDPGPATAKASPKPATAKASPKPASARVPPKPAAPRPPPEPVTQKASSRPPPSTKPSRPAAARASQPPREESRRPAASGRASSTPVTSRPGSSSRPVVSKQSSSPKPSNVSAMPRTTNSRPVSAPPGSSTDVDRRRQMQRRRAGRAMQAILRKVPISKSSSPPPTKKKKKTKHVIEAELAIEHERFADAIRTLKEALAKDPDDVDAKNLLKQARKGNVRLMAQDHLRRGRNASRDGLVEEAILNFEQALEIDGNNVEARHLLAELFLENRRELPRALTLIKEAIVVGGQRGKYFATLGELYALAKDSKKALEAFEKAVKLEPDNKEYKKRLKECRV